MMKKKKYFCVLLVAALTSLLATCVDENDPPGSESPDGIISVDEAKAFFEEQMMRIGEARDDNELQGLATEFTPLWSKAVISGKDSMVAVDVPITANSLFWAILPSKSDSTAMKSAVHMPQKLVVVKNRKTGNKGTYIVSLIPDRKMRISAMDFTNYGDYGNFSGRITYSLPLSAVPLRVDCFKEGRLTNAASIFGLKDRP